MPWLNTEDLAEQREMLTEAQYAQLHLNRWVESEDRLTSVDDLRAFGPVCVFRSAGALLAGYQVGCMNALAGWSRSAIA
ncbi:MAG TPA: hypothetical protein VKB17_07275 [Thermoleophilaceae bacterium]|nr:hypothetical protein [Thermoleophilaceae bacterium]